jgi:hypothetical protein
MVEGDKETRTEIKGTGNGQQGKGKRKLGAVLISSALADNSQFSILNSQFSILNSQFSNLASRNY